MDNQIFNSNDLPWIDLKQGKTKILLGKELTGKSSLRIFKLDPGKSFKSHEHEFLQCMYFTSGQGKVSIDDKSENISSGLTVIVLPQQCHSVVNTGSSPLEILVLEMYQLSSQDTPFVDF